MIKTHIPGKISFRQCNWSVVIKVYYIVADCWIQPTRGFPIMDPAQRHHADTEQNSHILSFLFQNIFECTNVFFVRFFSLFIRLIVFYLQVLNILIIV